MLPMRVETLLRIFYYIIPIFFFMLTMHVETLLRIFVHWFVISALR